LYPEKLQRIVLFVSPEPGHEQEYPVRVADIQDDVLITDIPLGSQGQLVRIPQDQIVYARYHLNDSMYQFPTHVLRYVPDQVPMMVLLKPSKDMITKLQRREYFRIPVSLSSLLRIENQETEVTLLDLSGGGFLFQPPGVPLQKGDAFSGTLTLPLKDKSPRVIAYQAKICRALSHPDTGESLFGAQFIQMTETDRDWIIRYCFEKQMEYRRKLG
jgi:c-di-GMP-binding flagellar brake protein YcgR